jgi:hypothetical protein
MGLLCGACGSDAGPPDARVPGTVSLTWTLHSGSRLLFCAAVDAATVQTTITAGAFTAVDVFSCATAMGTSRPILPGTYAVSVEVDGASGPISPVQHLDNIVVTAGHDTSLGNLDFAVDATGGLRFTVAASGAGSNCAAAPGGAGIDGMTLEILDTVHACEPATFMIGAGATAPAATYTSDCQSLPAGPCIESDQVVTVTGLNSGIAYLVVAGDVAGKACWKTSASAKVPTLSTTRDLGAVPLARDSVTCP